MTAADLTPHFANLGGDPIRDAFAARRAVLPWRNKRPLPQEQMTSTWARLMSSHRSPKKRLAYIHVPFCANHCLFCGFYRNTYTEEAASSYANLIVEEIEREATATTVEGQLVEAVYLGGGTPSALSAAELSHILTTVKRCLPLAPDCEITLEGRIIHFDPDKIDACLEAGVNRISIGVQSFDTTVRRRQGRRASKGEAIRFLEAIRDRDRAALVIDLLYGLPGQTDGVWSEDLRIAADLTPDGVDLYGLNLIPGTPLHKAIGIGKFSAAATLKDIGVMYRAGVEFLAAKGWTQVSNSHWARTPRERNIYNLRIKEGADCLAYGSGAGGTLGQYSYGIAADLRSYRDAVRAGRKPIDGIRVSDSLQPVRDVITAGLEIGRLDLDRIDLPDGGNLRTWVAPLLEQWRAAGLVSLSGNVVSLTTAGRFWYGNLIFAFDAVLSEDVRSNFETQKERIVTVMTDTHIAAARDLVRKELAQEPGGILEATATKHGLSLQDTIECLPVAMWKRISGAHFVDVMQDISEWGSLTVISHSKDAILEVEGPLPKGKLGHGFYNLSGGSALSGHLRASNCKSILFLRRPFMGTETLSIQFFNAEGEAMFKIFVGRDEERCLKTDQIERFGKLEALFPESGSVH